jgi:hypothetical protein
MVLLDFNFQRAEWWDRVLNTPRAGESQRPRFGTFHEDEALPLARDLLLEAWSAGRSTSQVCSLVFGMAPEVTLLIARLSPQDLDRVVVHEAQAMRLRWDNRPMFWKELFHAATQMDDQILANVHLHCLQLLGSQHAYLRAKPLASTPPPKGPVTQVLVEERGTEGFVEPRSLEFR